MEMVVGLASFRSERPNKHSRTERRSYCPISPNGPHIIQKRVSNAVNVRSRAPGVNASRAANLMRRRPVSAVGADENRRINFAPEVLQESGKQKDCTRYVMRELT